MNWSKRRMEHCMLPSRPGGIAYVWRTIITRRTRRQLADKNPLRERDSDFTAATAKLALQFLHFLL